MTETDLESQEPQEPRNKGSKLPADSAADTFAEDLYEEPVAEPAAKKEKKPKVGLLWLFVLASLIFSGVVGWFVNQLWQKSDASVQANSQQASTLQQSQTAIVDLRDDLGSLESTVQNEKRQRSSASASSSQQLALLKKSIDKQARHINELSSSNRDQWLLAEVEYLLRLANQRILMSKDSGGALAMLDSADRILHGIDDVSLHSVRRAIANDMASLRALEKVDIDGAYLQLSALSDQIDQLELYDIPDHELPEVDSEVLDMEQATPAAERMQMGLKAIGEAMSKAFVIRRDNQEVEAMLAPQDELYLRQNLRLMLEQAQLALMSRKQSVFEKSLEKAQRWIAQYFMVDRSATQTALSSLSTLSNMDVDPPLPDISGSFRALKNYQKSQMNARPGLDYTPPAASSSSRPATSRSAPPASRNTPAPRQTAPAKPAQSGTGTQTKSAVPTAKAPKTAAPITKAPAATITTPAKNSITDKAKAAANDAKEAASEAGNSVAPDSNKLEQAIESLKPSAQKAPVPAPTEPTKPANQGAGA